jgi:hypothetical protein
VENKDKQKKNVAVKEDRKRRGESYGEDNE